MKHNELSILLKVVTAVCMVLLVAFAVFGAPNIIRTIIDRSAFEQGDYPNLFTFSVIAVSIFEFIVLLGLIEVWTISRRIGKDQSFCVENAKSLKRIGILAFADTMFVVICDFVMLAAMFLSPMFLIGCVIVFAVGAAISVFAFVLSRLVEKATELQQDSDLTI